MNNAKFYSTAYPGSMHLKDDGSYVERSDQTSLAAAMEENFNKLLIDVEDWKAAAIQHENKNNQLGKIIDELNAALEGMARMADTEAKNGSEAWKKAANFARVILKRTKGEI